MILSSIRQVYIALHQGTDGAPTSFTPSTFPFDPVFDRISSYPLCTIQGHRHLDRFPQATDGETAPSFVATLSTRPDLHPFFAALDLDRARLYLGDVPDPLPQSLRRHALFLNLSIATTVQLLHPISPPPVQPNATLSSHLQRTPFLGLPLAAALFPNIPSQHLSPSASCIQRPLCSHALTHAP